MKTTIKCLTAVVMMLIFGAGFACSKKSGDNGGSRPVPPVTPQDTSKNPAPLISLPASWQQVSSYMVGLPGGIEVYRNRTPYASKPLNAYCVVFDPAVAGILFKPVLPANNKKVSAQFTDETGTVYACINGGFFGTNASYSLVKYNGAVSAVNIRSLTRSLNGTNTLYYPTRGAFGLDANNKPSITWIYNLASDNNAIYSYPSPSPNALNSAPLQQPDASFPAGGSLWNAVSAIGGSPVLIVDNVIRVTDTEEMIDIDNTSSRARSAIGFTADGKVIILAVEGGNPNGGTGLSLLELAGMMKEMGCKAALNLDGGSSTYMMVNGQATVKSSDAGGERAVMGAIILKKK